MATYKQLAITEFGEPEVLRVQEEQFPVLAEDHVLVRVAFIGVNPIDAKTRAGLGWAAKQNKDNLPWVPGYDIAGEIVQIADGVDSVVCGDKVAGFIGFPLQGGAYSEYVVVAAHALNKVPVNVALEQAAALPLAGQTAWQALDKVKVSSGERVLVLAGAGGVGHIAIQLAVAKGAEVFASCSARNLAFVSSLGAIAIDYAQAALDTQIEPVDALIDLVGGEVGIAALKCLKPSGRVVTVPTLSAEAVCERAKQLQLNAEGMLVSPSVEQNQHLLNRVADKQLTLHIDAKYALSDGVGAHKQIETGRTRGKIVLATNI